MVLGLFEVALFLFWCSFYKYFRGLDNTEILLSIGKKLAFSFNFILSPELGQSVKMGIFLSNLFTGKKVVCHGLLDCWITFQGCRYPFVCVVFGWVLFELFSRRVYFMVVDLLFAVFGVFSQMEVKDLAYRLKTVELVFLRFDAFVLFPDWTSAHLALLGSCCSGPHRFTIYSFLRKL